MKAHPSPNLPNPLTCAVRLKALADETRLAVVRHLMSQPCHVGDIQEALGVEQSLLSHHLRTLRDAGIVEATRNGKAMLYRLSVAMEQRRDGIVDLGCCQITFDPES